MADISRSVYLSRKFSSVNEDSSKNVYDGIFSASAATKGNGSSFAARINEYRDIFPPSSSSLGSNIPILDLPAGDRRVDVGSELDYADVFGGLGDNDGIEVATDKFFSVLKKSVKRDAHLPRIPVPTRRMPSKSQEFSFSNGNDQMSRPEKTKRIPSRSQEFSCNYGNDKILGPAQAARVPSKSQEFVGFHGHDQTSSLAQARRIASPSQEVSSNCVNGQTSSPRKKNKISSESQESSSSPVNDKKSSPAQTTRVPSKSQEFPFNYGNDQTSSPGQPRRMPSKSQEFSCQNGNDQMSKPPQLRKQYSQSQEFPSNFSTNQMPTSPVQTRRPFLSSEGDTLSVTCPNVLQSASALPHETVDSVKHVSFSYNKTNQLGIDSPNGMTHIAHLHAVPGYTHLFDETGPVRKPSFDKAKRLSMGDADFSTATAEVSRQGKHLRTVSDLGTNQQARDTDKPQTRSMSMSNSPQSFGSSGYYKRSSHRRNNRSTNDQENISYANPFMLLEEELDVNSTAAISAAALKRAVEEAEVKIRWAKEFLKDLEGNGFIKPTLKDSFKVKGDIGHSYDTYGIKQNRSMKIKLTRQKKFFNEEKVLKQNSYLNSDVSVGDCHSYEMGEVKPTFGLKQALHVLSAGVDTNVRNPTLENFEERNAYDELKFAEKSCKDESGGEWEAAKHLSQLFTGVKNRFVSFMSKQADTEKTVMQKDAPNNCEYMEQSRERPPEVCNLNNDRKMEADLDHTAEVKRSACYPAGNIDLELRTSDSAASPDTEILASKQCRLSEPEEQVECAEALVSENRRNDVKQGIATEVKGELLQEVREQNQEMLDEKVKIQSEIDMGTTGPEECNELLENDKVKNREYNEETVDVVPVLEPDETRVDESLKKEAVTSRQIEGCNLTEIEMLKDVKRKQGVRVEEEASMVEECFETSGGEEETCGEKDDTERITGPDMISETDECLTEVVNDISYEHDENLSATDELFLSRNQEFSVPDTINQYVQGVKSTQRASDVVDDESEHDEYLPAVDDILEQYEFLSSSRNEERDTQSQYAIDVDLPSQEGAALTEATSAIFELEGNSDRLRSVEMADQLNEECNSDISVSDIEGADDVCEKDENSCVNRNTETAIPDRNQYAQEERAYVENEKMTTGGQMENDLAGDISDLEDKETKEADDPSPSIDIEITEHDSVLKFEHNLSDEDDELEVSTREANGQDVSSHNSELSHRRRRWSDEVAKFHQPGILQENERTMEMDQENAETLAVKDGVEDCGDEIVNNSGEQEADGDDSDQDLDQKSEGLKSSGGSHRRRRRRRRWFDNSSENVQLEPSFVKPVGVTVVMDHEVAKHDVSSQSVDEKLARKREDVTDEMETANNNIPSDKAECGASTEAGHRRRRWFENGQKSEDPDTPKQELDETSSSEESANAQKSEEQMKAREKQAVERAIREARQRAFAEAKERANAVKAAAAAAASLQDKASMDAKLRAERAAVERATAEARERALQKSMSEKVIYKSREKVEFKNLNSGSSSSGISTSANVAPFTTGRPSGATESPQRRKAISERNKRTTERAAKALEEKNMRDVLAQKEHAERNRLAGVLDAEVKRWSTGKEGNLRYLLSTLQYILGPDSGWQPIPLTDLVTTTAVRKAYKRAALCVHPDKLQQRRATVQQKYICEKVFDLLKDAWLKFNPDEM